MHGAWGSSLAGQAADVFMQSAFHGGLAHTHVMSCSGGVRERGSEREAVHAHMLARLVGSCSLMAAQRCRLWLASWCRNCCGAEPHALAHAIMAPCHHATCHHAIMAPAMHGMAWHHTMLLHRAVRSLTLMRPCMARLPLANTCDWPATPLFSRPLCAQMGYGGASARLHHSLLPLDRRVSAAEAPPWRGMA